MQRWADISKSREPLSEKRSYFEAKIDHFIGKRLFSLFLISRRFGHILTLTITQLLNPTTIFHEKKNNKNSNLIYKATLLVKTETSRHTEKHFFSRLYEELNLRRPSRAKSGYAAFLTFPKLRSWLFLLIKKTFSPWSLHFSYDYSH